MVHKISGMYPRAVQPFWEHDQKLCILHSHIFVEQLRPAKRNTKGALESHNGAKC